MSQHKKLVADFAACTGPFPYRDVQRLLAGFGYVESTAKGSARRFHNPSTGHIIRLHEPHPGTDILLYMVKQIRASLQEKGIL